MSKFINRSNKLFNIDIIFPNNKVNHISTCSNNSKIINSEIFKISILTHYYKAEFIDLELYNTVNIIDSKINIQLLFNYYRMTNYNIVNSIITCYPKKFNRMIDYRTMVSVTSCYEQGNEDEYEEDDYYEYFNFIYFERILQKLNIN